MAKNNTTYVLNAVGGALRSLRAQCEQRSTAPLIVALSGGADSVALLCALRHLRVPTVAAHCNFHLRGDESNRDEAFVRALCARLDVALEFAEFDAAAEAERERRGIEVTCRDLRYRWFDELMLRHGACRVATGHHAGDQAETVLLNLMRGSGSMGLAGMLEDDGTVFRPLLSVTREEILGYLDEIGESYVTDSTNAQQDYRRNFVRHSVLPLLKEQWPGAEQVLCRVADTMQREGSIVRREVSSALRCCKHSHSERGEVCLLPWSVYENFADPCTLVYYFLTSEGVGSDRASKIAKEVARSAPRPETGKRWVIGSRTLLATRRGLSLIES